MSARVLQFRPRAPHVPRHRVSGEQLMLLVILAISLANFTLVTLGIVFIARGFR